MITSQIDTAPKPKCTCFQSNHEGDLVDTAKAVRPPIVAVRISKVEEREDFRQVSHIRQVCFEIITGMGIQGYRKAILDLAEKHDL